MSSQHGAPELGLAAEMMSRTAGETGSMLALSLGVARFTMSARMRRPSGSSSICRRSPERTECDSAKAFQPCSVYSNLLLFLHSSNYLYLATATWQASACHFLCPVSSLV